MATTSMDQGSQIPEDEIKRPTAPQSKAPPVSDHFVALANRVIAMRGDVKCSKTVGIAACFAKEGTTTVAKNLAIALAAAVPGPVLFVQTHGSSSFLRRRGQTTPGWAELLTDDVEVADAIQDSRIAGLATLPPGRVNALGTVTIDMTRLNQVVQVLKEEFEFIVLDLPCANELTSCYPIARTLDGVLLVVQADRVKAQHASRVKRQLDQAGAQVVGVVLNKKRFYVPRWLSRLVPFSSPSY